MEPEACLVIMIAALPLRFAPALTAALPPRSIASLPWAFYDPPQQCGDVPVAREQRKLAAILAADFVGYFRLMGLAP